MSTVELKLVKEGGELMFLVTAYLKDGKVRRYGYKRKEMVKEMIDDLDRHSDIEDRLINDLSAYTVHLNEDNTVIIRKGYIFDEIKI